MNFPSFLFLFPFLLLLNQNLAAQDTIFLKGDTIRVGELEWDMEKDYLAKVVLLTENKDLYGENVKIFLGYHSNRMVEQIVFGYIDENGFIPHGPARYYYSSGHLLGKRYYDQGKLNGKAEDFYKDGNIQMRSFFKDDLLHGLNLSFYENGTRDQVSHYDSGQLYGVFKSYYNNKKLRWVEYFDSSGVKQGLDSTFYETGKLESVFHFKDGLENEEAKYFHRNGRIWTQQTYEAGRLKNVDFIKDNKGKELETGSFENGFGWLFIYNDEGVLLAREKYKYGWLKKTKSAKN